MKQPNRRPSKIRPVPLGKMRIPPALVTQREFRKAHGDRIASELDLDKLGYPIINHRGDNYWVCDGQHRVYALKQFGFDDSYVIDCEVYEDLTDPEMAEIFLGRDARRAISSYDKFHVACTAGRKREADVRRTVEANGLKIGRVKEDHTIGAIGALCKVYDRSGAVVLGQTVRALKVAFAGDPRSFTPELIEGMGLVFNRYNGKTNEKEISARLAAAAGGVRGVLHRVESLRERTGNQKAQCVAATVVDIYNRGVGPRAKDRLPSWWKEDAQARVAS
jgi:hypothetical protein